MSQFFTPFISRQRKTHLAITVICQNDFDEWIKMQDSTLKVIAQNECFEGKMGNILIRHDATTGEPKAIYMGTSNDFSYDDGAKACKALQAKFSEEFLKKVSFSLVHDDEKALMRLSIGWGWACYSFNTYKSEKTATHPGLVLTNTKTKSRTKAFIEATCLARDLINTPANDMGPDELEDAAAGLCKHHDIKLKVIKDKDLIKKNFPMIFDVGKASDRRPRLLDFTWGNPKHPKVTIVGKGVCFDTGGLDIKPSQFMLHMKKDMGGSAQSLGLAHLIMSLKLPIRLRVLIPAVENSISGNAYRPSDVLQTRKGITVEVGNTDAEGRLVLADALCYACEDKPDLLIDFATLTGAARVALGTEIPGLFSNKDETAHTLQTLSLKDNIADPLWHLPLWQNYRKEMDSPCADINSTGGKAGATIAALFLNEFIEDSTEWVHIDCYAWKDSDTPTNPKGGADTGMRALFHFIEERYQRK